MRRTSLMLLLLLLGLLLAACSSSPSPSIDLDERALEDAPVATAEVAASGETTSDPDQVAPADLPAESGSAETRVDEQGAVIVSVTPLNLGTPGATVDFAVSLETHSVDLSMNLVELATLTTDNGLSVEASGWDGPQGGHHVEGTLSFPAEVNGEPLVADAAGLTVSITNVDAPERVFTWELP